MMGSGRRQSHSRQQIGNFQARPHSTIPYLQEEPSPPYTTSSGNYSPGTQHNISPASRQGTPGAFPAGTSHLFVQLGQPDSRVTPPPAPVRATGNGNVKIGARGKLAAALASPAPSKSKRVRTGCLTCRERHLKCDERVPDCNNCRKSNRECRRGIRLNFIDVQVNDPPCVPKTAEWSVQILDESRLIASEYKGGLGRYPRLVTPFPATDLDAILCSRTGPPEFQRDTCSPSGLNSNRNRPVLRDRQNPNDVGQPPPHGSASYVDGHLGGMRGSNVFLAASSATGSRRDPTRSGEGVLARTPPDDHCTTREETSLHAQKFRSDYALPSTGRGQPSHRFGTSGHNGPSQLLSTPVRLTTPSNRRTTAEKIYLSTDDDIRFVQVFIDEVAIWMDSLDTAKHFANTVPYLALKSPMMLNALLACGARQLTLMGEHTGETAEYYYGMATTHLLQSRQDPDCDLATCAITAVALNAYGIMSDKPTQRMDHISSTRALIRECGWDASSTGLGAACFWINVGMEVLSCIAFGWHTAWAPDQWGLDLEFTKSGASSRSGGGSVVGGDDCGRPGAEREGRQLPVMASSSDFGDEELWAQRILYILAKVANFRASVPQFQEPSPHDEQVRQQGRFAEWLGLQNMCNTWNLNCPQSMRVYGYSPGPSETSLFPNVWLIKSSAKLGRLFYHTAMFLLAQTNPLDPRDSGVNCNSQRHHAHQVCGIVAHTRDRGVSSVAIRSIAVVSIVLVDRDEQNQVLDILRRISRETGWRLGKVVEELKSAWGWEDVGTASSSVLNHDTLAPLPVAGLPAGGNMQSGRRMGEGNGRSWD